MIPFFKKIQTRLTVSVIVLIIIPMLGIMYVFFIESERTLGDKIKNFSEQPITAQGNRL